MDQWNLSVTWSDSAIFNNMRYNSPFSASGLLERLPFVVTTTINDFQTKWKWEVRTIFQDIYDLNVQI